MDTIETPIWDGKVIAPILPHLGPASLRRLQRLQARVDGATEVAQAAVTAHTAARDAYQAAFLAACEDSEIEVPAGQHDVDIDWNTGEVRFMAKND